MKKIKIPYIGVLPVLIIAFLLFKLIYTTDLSMAGIFKVLYDCIAYFVVGFILAYLLNPAMRFFENLIRSSKDTLKIRRAKRIGVIAFIYLLMVGVLTIFVVAVIPTIRTGVREVIDNLPRYTENVESWLEDFALASDPVLSATLEKWLDEGFKLLYNWLRGMDFSSIGGAVSTAVSSSATAIIRFFFGVVVSLYFLYSKERLLLGTKKLMYALMNKVKADKLMETGNQVNTIFLNYIVSKLLQSLIIFVIGLLVLVPLGVPLAPLFALFIGLTNMIPYFGPYIGAVPCIVIALFYSPLTALWVLVYAVGVQILDNIIIGPKIMSEQVGISPLLVIAGVTIGGSIGGIFGMLLGVPVVAVVKLVFYDPFITRRLREKEIDI